MTSLPPRSVKVTDVNPHLLCVLCGGYYVDATTIIECLHSFCKSCIVRYLETNKYCPICDVQVHKTKPLLNIRSDRTLQAIVYKLVPGLFQRELICRREFYKKYPGARPVNAEDAGELTDDSPIYLPDEPILLGVQYADASTSKANKRFLKCPAALTIHHLHKLMRAKFNLGSHQRVEFLHEGDSLPDFLSLMDLAYMYHWKRKHPVELEYRLLEYQQKKVKLSHEENCSLTSGSETNKSSVESEKTVNQPDREVQLQISENGVISVHSVNASSVSDTVVSSKSDSTKSAPVPTESLPIENIQPETIELMKSLEKTVTLDFDSSFAKKDDAKMNCPVNDIEIPTHSTDTENICKNKANHSLTIDSTKDEPSVEDKNKPAVIRKNLVNSPISNIPSVSISNTSVSIHKVYPGVKEVSSVPKPFRVKEPTSNVREYESSLKLSSEKHDVTKPPNPIRYKTLKSPVKPWDPSIPRSSLMAMKQAQSASRDKPESLEKTPTKTAKFFKMRNVPRFLGNPASGVKPMYQVLPGTELNSQTPQSSSAQSSKQGSEITVMKIDPKTLNPIPVSQSSRPKSTSSSALPIFANSPQKSSESHLNSRTPIRNPVSKSVNKTGQVHSTSLTSNPFILPSSHMVYSGFPRPFSPVDSTGSRMPSDSQIFRAMSMLCSPSAAFHPSLPPSISMLFNPHHPHHRSSQNEKLKYTPSDFHKMVPATTPSVQRVPPSCPTTKHSSATLNSPVAANDPNSSNHDHLHGKITAKINPNEKHSTGFQENSLQDTSVEDQKGSSGSIASSGQNALQHRLLDRNCVPLSNGLSVSLSKHPEDNVCRMPSSDKEETGDRVPLTKDTVEQTNRVDNKAGKSDNSSLSQSSYCSSVN